MVIYKIYLNYNDLIQNTITNRGDDKVQSLTVEDNNDFSNSLQEKKDSNNLLQNTQNIFGDMNIMNLLQNFSNGNFKNLLQLFSLFNNNSNTRSPIDLLSNLLGENKSKKESRVTTEKIKEYKKVDEVDLE